MYSKRSIRHAVVVIAAVLAVILATAVSGKLLFDKLNHPKNPTMNDTILKNQEVEEKPAVPKEPASAAPAVKPNLPIEKPAGDKIIGPVLPSEPKDAYESIGASVDLSGLSADYQKKYMGLYATPAEIVPTDDKVVYLTFDDGPSANTAAVLDELDKYGIKATFFVVTGNKNTEHTAEQLKEIVKRGHAIGIHTYTHQYKEIYANVDAFLSDMNKVNEEVYNATGLRPSIYRFPGGSLNNFNKAVVHDIMAEMSRRGFQAYDWNSSLQDAEGKKYTQHQLAENAISTFSERKRVIILAHDGGGQKTTPQAIGEIHDYAKANGYRFDVLNNTVAPITFVKKK